MTESKIQTSGYVLLVDDNDSLRTGLKKLLMLRGYRVIEASDPEVAFVLLRQFEDEVQVLVTDIVMPSMNGFEFSRKVHSLYPRIGVLHISAYGTAESPDPHPHADVVLRKPITINLLVEALESVLRRPPAI